MNAFNVYQQPIGAALPGWQPRPFPERVVLKGDYCRLEPLQPGHAAALFQAHQRAGDNRSWTWLLREPEQDEAAFSAWVTSVCDLRDPLHFAVIDKPTGLPVGSLSLMRID